MNTLNYKNLQLKKHLISSVKASVRAYEKYKEIEKQVQEYARENRSFKAQTNALRTRNSNLGYIIKKSTTIEEARKLFSENNFNNK